jgi:predicted acetylornithine/succinylornithine family transaminase
LIYRKEIGKMEEIREWADKTLFKTYARFPIVVEKAEGCLVWDSEGRPYLDLVAGIAVCNVGHGHQKVIEAIERQLPRLIHISNLYYTRPQVELARRLVENSFADRVFFCNSGAEANEGAIKLARKYAKDRGHPERFEAITMIGSFHGRTLSTVAATGQQKYKKGFEPLPEGFTHIPFDDLAALEAAVSERTCAVMVEPIQGEGGVNLPSEGYLEGIRALCDQRDILLIFDEIQTGMGRTGKLFAYEHHGIVPDVMTLAKGIAGGLPMGAILAKEEVAQSLVPGTHASTFGGNPVCAAAGTAVLSILLEDSLIDQCRVAGRYFLDKLKPFEEIYPQVRAVRGRGLILAMELEVPGSGIVNRCMEKGLLINCTMDKVLRFIPPLTITEVEIDQAIDILKASMDEEFKAQGGESK